VCCTVINDLHYVTVGMLEVRRFDTCISSLVDVLVISAYEILIMKLSNRLFHLLDDETYLEHFKCKHNI